MKQRYYESRSYIIALLRLANLVMMLRLRPRKKMRPTQGNYVTFSEKRWKLVLLSSV